MLVSFFDFAQVVTSWSGLGFADSFLLGQTDPGAETAVPNPLFGNPSGSKVVWICRPSCWHLRSFAYWPELR